MFEDFGRKLEGEHECKAFNALCEEISATRETQRLRRQLEQDARQRLEDWLRQEKFAGVNDKRKSLMKSKYPLHSAVKRKDAATIQLLIRFGADPTYKDSKGLTPKELAEKGNTDGSMDAIVQFLAKVPMKGCAGGA